MNPELLQRNVEHLTWEYPKYWPRLNHVLLYGKPENTQAVLRALYERCPQWPEARCTYHDASQIQHPKDFFEPILRLKYGEEYAARFEALEAFRKMLEGSNPEDLSFLSAYCARDKQALPDSPRAKQPLIFIEGIEELFFKMDFPQADWATISRTASFGRNFGNSLRANLHQTDLGTFFGTVRDMEGVACQATLNNYHYMFYADNFKQFKVREE